uniref:carbonyl reductase (NADPH) n=1 Tax=Canis lupus familiaris TaxID=9615 RepID=A0A8C0PU80_CANLF
MSAASRVALVTGANKGIGFAIARELCRQFSGDVVLTARDEARGRAAVQQLQAEGLSPRFHLLDIDDLQSIRALRDFLRKEYGGLDVLVNNAGIAFKTNDPTPFHIQAEVTMKTNFFGTRDVCTELLPLMKPQADDPTPLHIQAEVTLKTNFFGTRDICTELLPLVKPQADDPTPLHIQAEVTLKTNFFGTRDICTELLPLVKPQGRVVNVSSVMGFVTLKQCSPELQQKFTSEAITEEELGMLMNKFVEDVKNGVHKKEGWPDMKLVTYGISKMGITILSRIHARKLSEQRRGDKIFLNACCPGWLRTDMGGPKGIKSPEEGAETPVYLALLPSDAEGPHGEFVMEKKVEQWGLSFQFPPWIVI